MTVRFVCRLGVLVVLCGWMPLIAEAQPASYARLVADAQADLTAGNAAAALTESRKAIAVAPRRWEAYVVAGGALEIEKRYNAAIDEFTRALEYAPKARKAAVRGLLEKCAREQAGAPTQAQSPSAAAGPAQPPASETNVTQAEVVLWKTIQGSANPADFEAYLQQYPNGAFAPLAREHLASLKKAQAEGLYSRGLALYERRAYSGAVADFQKACDGGNAPSCTNLGYMYEQGYGVTKDESTAAQLYRKACDGGDTPACNILGIMYDQGQGVARDYSMAAQLYCKACDGGDTPACNTLGIMYDQGRGVAKDESRAQTLFAKACGLGFKPACAHVIAGAR